MKKIITLIIIFVSLLSVQKITAQIEEIGERFHVEYELKVTGFSGPFNVIDNIDLDVIFLDGNSNVNQIGVSASANGATFNNQISNTITGSVILNRRADQIRIRGDLGRSNPSQDDDDEVFDFDTDLDLPTRDFYSFQTIDGINNLFEYEISFVVVPIIIQEVNGANLGVDNPLELCGDESLITNLGGFNFDLNTRVFWEVLAEKQDSFGLIEVDNFPGFFQINSSLTSANINFGADDILNRLDDVGVVSHTEFLNSNIIQLRMRIQSSSLGINFIVDETRVQRAIEICSPEIISFNEIEPQCFTEEGGSFTMVLDQAIDPSQELFVSVFKDMGNLNGTFEEEEGFTTNFDSNTGQYLNDNSNLVINTVNNTTTYTWQERDIAPLLDGNYRMFYQLLPSDTSPPSGGINPTSPTSLEASAPFDIVIPEPVVFDAIEGDAVMCFGDLGSILIENVAGGTGPYEYQLNGGAWIPFTGTGTEINNRPAGSSNTIRVRDSNGCVAQEGEEDKTVAINFPSFTAIEITRDLDLGSEPSFNGGTDGSIFVNVEGGTAGYEFSWSNGRTTQNNLNIGAGSYTLTVTDSNGCIGEPETFVLGEPEPLEVTIGAGTLVSCFNGTNGSLNVTNVSGGVLSPGASYSFEWFEQTTIGPEPVTSGINASGEIISGLSAGTYFVAVTDSNTITENSTPITIINPSQITFTATVGVNDNVSCNGEDDGVIRLTANGGTITSYRYELFEGATFIEGGDFTGTTHNITGLEAGSYNVRLTNTNECTGFTGISNNLEIAPVTITEPELLVINQDIDFTFVRDVSQANAADGVIQVSVLGGTPGFRYELFQGTVLEATSGPALITGTTREFTELSEGNYRVRITDANNCFIERNFEIATVAALELGIPDIITPTCSGDSDGSITINPVGGTAPYEFIFSTTPGVTTTNATLSNLSAGDYNVTIIDSNEVTITSGTITVEDPEIVAFTAIEGTFNCAVNEYVIDINATGGNGSYEYELNSSNTWIPFPSEGISVSLPSGIYNVRVRDTNECVAVNEDGSTGVATLTFLPITALASVTGQETNPTGNGLENGSISAVVVTGGSGNYSYLWSTGATTPGLPAIGAGEYTITVTDTETNCTIEETFTLGEPGVLGVNISAAAAINCFEGTTTLTATAIGGVPNDDGTYTNYTWFNAAGDELQNGPSATFVTGTGNYFVIVEDSNENTAASNLAPNTNFALPEPSRVTFTAGVLNNVFCNGGADGSISLTANGDTPNFEFRITRQDAGNTITDWIDFDLGNTHTINDLTAGAYNVEVRSDLTECTGFDANDITSSIIELEITEPIALSYAIVSANNPNAFGSSTGSIVLEVSGGLPFDGDTTNTYEASLAGDTTGTEVIEITNNVITINNLSNGSYTITVSNSGFNLTTGANQSGCSITTSEITLTEPPALSIEITNAPIPCFEGTTTLEADVSGGIEDYVYEWFSVDTTTNTRTTLNITTPTIENLPAGVYTVMVTDNNGVGIAVFGDNQVVTEPDPITITNPVVTQLLCFGENTASIAVEISGGTVLNDYRYTWVRVAPNGVETTDVEFDNFYEDLGPGTYTLTVTDDNECSSAAATFTIDELPVYDVVNANIMIPIEGDLNGSISVEVIGGQPPYSYQWFQRNEAGIFEPIPITIPSATGLGVGDYQIIITDAINCTHSETYTLDIPGQLIAGIEETQGISCAENSDATLFVSTEGGAGGNTFAWFDASTDTPVGNNSQFLAGVPVGSYYVVVTDVAGTREQSPPFTVGQPDELVLSFTSEFSGCGTSEDWTITANVIGGTAPYSYSWSNGAETQTLTGVAPGTYLLIVEDANGCRVIENETIEMPDPLEVEETITQITCSDACEGSIALAITGGLPPYAIEWNTGAITESLNNLCPDTYIVRVTDQNGCEFTNEYIIENASPIVVDLGEDRTLCLGQEFSLDIGVNQTDVSYGWSSSNGFTSTSPSVTLTEAGVYTATITTAAGCIGTDSIEVFESGVGVSSEFLVTSQAFAGEQIVIVNTSNPISEDGDWILPEAAEIVELTDDLIAIMFADPGTYEVTLRSFEGDCFEDFTKSILVGEARELPAIELTDTPLIDEFTLFPNPSSGNFTTEVTLTREAKISLRFFGAIDGILYDDRELIGDQNYVESYNMNLPSGTYILLLETFGGSEIRRIIIE